MPLSKANGIDAGRGGGESSSPSSAHPVLAPAHDALHPVIIIGSGLAGYTTAREFRKLDKETPLYIITADDGCFYSKPMLSNAFTVGKTPAQIATSNADQMATQLNATVRTHTHVDAIDTSAHTIIVEGYSVPYKKLVLALGADPFRPDLTGDAVQDVLSVNDLDHYARFRQALDGKKRVAIIGSGLIGCEFANDLSNAGYVVDVIDPGTRPLRRLLPEVAAQALQSSLTAIGVTWHFGKKLVAVNHLNQAYQLSFSDGTSLVSDAVLSAIGLRPRTNLADSAGITVNRGVVVDTFLKSSADDVYALGDCAEVMGLVLPFVMPIMHAARALAKTLSGSATPLTYPAMPVVIKTPACPIVVSLPAAQVTLEWQITADGSDVLAKAYDPQKRLQGFVLTGKATGERQALTQQLPAVL